MNKTNKSIQRHARLRLLGIVVGLFTAGLLPPAEGTIVPLLTSPGLGATTTPTGQTVGYSFLVGNDPLRVGALGFWDQDQDGLAFAHDVGLWNSGGTLVANATVPSGTGGFLIGEWRYASIGPVSLLANSTYTIGALLPTGNTDAMRSNSGNVQTDGTDVGFWNPGWVYNPALTAADPTYNFTGLWVVGPSLARPVNGLLQGQAYSAPNLLIVPEPAVLLLFGMGGWLMLRVGRRRK